MKILAFVDRRFPCDHSFLEGLMEKRLTSLGHEILWVMRSGEPQAMVEEKTWHNSSCLVLPRSGGRGTTGVFRRYLSMLRSLAGLRKRFRGFSPDVIFVRNDPALLLFSLVLSRSVKAPVVFQLSHLKEEEVIERLPLVGLRTKAMYVLMGVVGKALRNFLITRADHILPISDEMKKHLSATLPADRMTVMPLGVEGSGKSSENKPAADPLDGRKYLLYIGTMAISRRLDVVVDAFDLIKDNFPGLKLVFLGGGGEAGARDTLMKYVRDKGMDDSVVFIPQVPRKEVSRYINGAVASISVIPPAGVMRTLSPTKLMEYMAEASPVLATRGIPEQETIVEDSGGGILVDFEPESIAKGMRWLVDNPSRAREMGRKGRDYILSWRNYDRMVYDVEAVFKEVFFTRSMGTNVPPQGSEHGS